MSSGSFNPEPGGPGGDRPGAEPSRRVERALFETDRQIVVGDVTLPPEGYQSRFSDLLNREGLEFIPITDAVVTLLADGTVAEHPFLVLSKRHVRLSYPLPR